MKQDYKKITGHANYGDDGILLEQIIAENKGKITIVELGANYGRHAVLWSQILEYKKQEAKHIILDATDYEGHEVAQTYAEKRFDEFQCAVNFEKVDTLANSAEKFENETLDVVFLDCIQTKDKLLQIVKKWLPKINVGGTFVYLQSPHKEDIDNNGVIVDELTKNAFLIETTNNLVICKKQLQLQTKKTDLKPINKMTHQKDGN